MTESGRHWDNVSHSPLLRLPLNNGFDWEDLEYCLLACSVKVVSTEWRDPLLRVSNLQHEGASVDCREQMQRGMSSQFIVAAKDDDALKTRMWCPN